MAAAALECAVADDRRIIPVIGDSAVHVGHGLLTQIAAELTPKNGIKASKFVIVSDANVWALYGQQLVDSFLALGGFKLADCLDKPTSSEPGAFAMMCSCGDVPTEVGDDGKLLLTFQVPAGEGSKSRKVKTEIEDFMLRPMLTRSTHHGLRTVHTGYAYQPPACRTGAQGSQPLGPTHCTYTVCAPASSVPCLPCIVVPQAATPLQPGHLHARAGRRRGGRPRRVRGGDLHARRAVHPGADLEHGHARLERGWQDRH